MGQLGELEKAAAAIRALADAYVINPDTPANSRKVLEQSRLSIPILLDPTYSVAHAYGLPGQGRPMGGLVGFVIMDRKGIVQVQRVDIDFGVHAPQIVDILRRLIVVRP